MRVSHQIVENIKYLNSDQRRLGVQYRPSSLKVLNSLLLPLKTRGLRRARCQPRLMRASSGVPRMVKLQKTLESPGYTDEKTEAQKEEKATSI